MRKKIYKFRIEVGDFSGDGSDRREFYELQSTKSPNEIEKLYNQICKKLKFSFKDFCNEYNDAWINVNILKKLGLDPKNYKLETHEEETLGKGFFATSDDWINLWLDFMNHHFPDLKLKHVPNNIKYYPLDIGGYGVVK